MKAITLSVLGLGATFLLIGAKDQPAKPAGEVTASVDKGLRWLVSTQGKDGGWGQDGGATSNIRQGERLESQGNDVANTAVALLALVRGGHTWERGTYRDNVRKGVEFILSHAERAPDQGLAITSVQGTQIQRKLGPFIDTFLASMLFSELKGQVGDQVVASRVDGALKKCVTKIQANQLKDGSWNISGGWAPILGTSIASRSLAEAESKGVAVNRAAMDRIGTYTKEVAKSSGGGRTSAELGSLREITVSEAASPVALYASAQQLEQLTRNEKDRRDNRPQIRQIVDKLGDASFVRGFGSMGGEEFFSYLNISDSLKRSGGEEWTKWNKQIQGTLVSLQNNDGTWAGHHCITGRVAVTSAAILTLVVERN